MTAQWFYLKDDGVQQGPVTAADLKSMAAAGKLAPTDMVWKEGMNDWADASKVKGLQFGSARAPRPPAAAKAPQPAKAPPPRQQAAAQLPSIEQFIAQPEYDDFAGLDDPLGGAAAFSASMPNVQAPMQPSGPSFAPSSGFGGNPYASSMARARKPFRPKVKTSVWASFLILAGFLMIASFASPWWGMYVKLELSEEEKKEMQAEAEKALEEFKQISEEEMLERMTKAQEEADEMRRKQEEWDAFYKKYDVGPGDEEWGRKQRQRFLSGSSGDDAKEKSKIWLVWGWQTGSGITGLILGLILIPLVIVFGFIRSLQPWSWIAFFLSVGAGVAMVIMFPVWFFNTPDTNATPMLRQGVIAGPWLALVSGLITVACGLTGAIMGLIAFVKR